MSGIHALHLHPSMPIYPPLTMGLTHMPCPTPVRLVRLSPLDMTSHLLLRITGLHNFSYEGIKTNQTNRTIRTIAYHH